MTESHKKEASQALEKIFEHRNSHIIIGLTGRTGSGCSSIAEILSTEKFSEIKIQEINSPPTNHEDRKNRIIKDWLEVNWNKFSIIKVSEVLFLCMLCNRKEQVIQYVSNTFQSSDGIEIIRGDEFSGILERYYEIAVDIFDVIDNIKSKNKDEISKAFHAIFDVLPLAFEEMQSIFKPKYRALYTRIFQKFGDNIRASGSVVSEEIKPGEILSLPKIIGKIIDLHREVIIQDEYSNKKIYVVIDAIRHPYEVRYLRERNARFYLVAVTTEDQDRKARLHSLQYTDAEIKELDEKEYPSERSVKYSDNYQKIVSQDVQACLALADIYIRNLGRPEKKDLRKTTMRMLRYIALMQHPGIVTPTSIERCMQVAFSARVNSGCISRQVGAVVTDNKFSIRAIGWNDVPKGQVPCLLRNIEHLKQKKDEFSYSQYELNDNKFRDEIDTITARSNVENKGRNQCFCFKDIYNKVMSKENQVHTRALHAEENAFLQIARNGGQGIEGGNLFSTASPCELCAKKAYQLGIKEIYYIDPYPGISVTHVLSSGENKPTITLFLGAIGRAYHDLYEPILPYKDELEQLLT